MLASERSFFISICNKKCEKIEKKNHNTEKNKKIYSNKLQNKSTNEKKTNTVRKNIFTNHKKNFFENLNLTMRQTKKVRGMWYLRTQILNALLRQAFGKVVILGSTRILG